jgi:hypothetical protein
LVVFDVEVVREDEVVDIGDSGCSLILLLLAKVDEDRGGGGARALPDRRCLVCLPPVLLFVGVEAAVTVIEVVGDEGTGGARS